MNMTRREFCIAAAAAQAMAAMPSFGGAAGGGKKRWYKGNMHCHTYWSDGRAFPDQAIRSYRDAGYDFCAVTDHNRMGENRDFWRKVEPTEGGWPPLVCRKNFDIYRKEFPWAEFREATGAPASCTVSMNCLNPMAGAAGSPAALKWCQRWTLFAFQATFATGRFLISSSATRALRT